MEVCTFRLTGDDADFVAADARMQTEFVYQQRGVVRRTTARGDDGAWLVLTIWQSRDDAEAAERAAATDVVAAEWWSFVDRDSVDTRRFETLD